MADNLKTLKERIITDIDPAGAPGSILAQNHQEILFDVLDKVGKHTGFSYTANKVVATFPNGTMSWESNAMNTVVNFDIKVSKLTSDLNNFGHVLDLLSAGDLLKFKDFAGRTVFLEYVSHVADVDGSANDIFVITVKGKAENINYTYQDTEVLTCVFEAINAGSGNPDGSETKIIAGTNVSVSGTGTIGDPYIVNSTANDGQRRRAVIDIVDNTAVPPTEVLGDRYILDETGGGVNAGWDGASANDIVEFDGANWIAETPIEGWTAYVDNQDNQDAVFVDDGVPAWELRTAGGGVSVVEYQTEITANENLTGAKKGIFKIYPVSSAGDIQLTLDEGSHVENDVIILERRLGTVEVLNGTNTIIRGVRDGENRFFIKDPYSLISLVCRGVVSGNTEWTIAGNLTRGNTGAPTVTLWTAMEPATTADVPVVGSGFSSNMRVSISGNGTLNSFVVSDSNNMTLNITSSGLEGDFLSVVMDNGEISTFTDVIELTASAGIAMVITTESTSATWSPSIVTKSGSTLTWTVTGGASGVYNSNDPTIDLSGNVGTATITVTSADDLAGLTQLRFLTFKMKTIDVTDVPSLTQLRFFDVDIDSIVGLDQLTALTFFELRNNDGTLSSIDLSNNNLITTLDVYANSTLQGINISGMSSLVTASAYTNATLSNLNVTGCTSLQTLNVSSGNLTTIDGLSSCTALVTLKLDDHDFITLDISALTNLVTLTISSILTLPTLNTTSNTLLKNITMFDTDGLTQSGINNIILEQDAKGLSNGNMDWRNITNPPSATESVANDVLDAYNNLIGRGYTLQGTVPA